MAELRDNFFGRKGLYPMVSSRAKRGEARVFEISVEVCDEFEWAPPALEA